MITSPNMGLLLWNLGTDPYNHEELAENWAKVDEHDHTPGKGLRISTGAIADGAITSAKIAPGATTTTLSVNQVTTTTIADGAVTTAKIANTAVTDAKMASPTTPVYKTIMEGNTLISLDAAPHTFLFPAVPGYVSGTNNVLVSGAIPLIYLVADDYAVTNKSTKLRVRAQAVRNATAPAITFTAGLYPVTFAGGNDLLVPTLGTLVTGSSAALTTPPVQNNSGDFNLPADGYYSFGVVTTQTIANNSAVQISAQLQVRHV